MAETDTKPRAAVIAIAGYRKGGGLVALDEIESYWTRLRDAAGDLPGRGQIEPRGFARALSNAFIAEATTARHLRLRLAGQHLQDLMGMDMRGMPVSALVLPESRPRLEEEISGLLADMSRPVRLQMISPRGYGRQALFAGMVLLPLAREEGMPPRVLGGIASVGTVGWSPRRFQIIGTGIREEAPVPERATAPTLRVIEGGVMENA